MHRDVERADGLDSNVEALLAIMGRDEAPSGRDSDPYLAQFMESRPYLKRGDYQLMLAVLKDGLELLKSARLNQRAFRRLDAEERHETLKAVVWFLTPGTSYLYNFESALEYLQLDPDRIRAVVCRFLRKDLEELDSWLREEATYWLERRGGGS